MQWDYRLIEIRTVECDWGTVKLAIELLDPGTVGCN